MQLLAAARRNAGTRAQGSGLRLGELAGVGLALCDAWFVLWRLAVQTSLKLKGGQSVIV
jgi:hypothetical protein